MRVFYALTFEASTKEALAVYRDIIVNGSINGRFTDQGNFHLTLAFIGEVSRQELNCLLEILETFKPEPITLIGTHIGRFQKHDREVVWMGIKEDSALVNLQKALVMKLRKAGFELQHQEYVPHITLGRQVLTKEDLQNFELKPITMDVKSMALMESIRVGGKLVYRPVEKIVLFKEK